MNTATAITISGITATLIESDDIPSNHRLWRLRSGALIVHRITSKGGITKPETFIFSAREDGTITDWCELSGSCSGERSNEEAIKSHIEALARV